MNARLSRPGCLSRRPIAWIRGVWFRPHRDRPVRRRQLLPRDRERGHALQRSRRLPLTARLGPQVHPVQAPPSDLRLPLPRRLQDGLGVPSRGRRISQPVPRHRAQHQCRAVRGQRPRQLPRQQRAPRARRSLRRRPRRSPQVPSRVEAVRFGRFPLPHPIRMPSPSDASFQATISWLRQTNPTGSDGRSTAVWG